MLTRVFCDNFRAMVNFEFRPEQLCLLLGENGSGKTTLFEALGRLSDIIVLGASVSDYFSHSRTRWDTREIQRFEMDIDGNGGRYSYSLEVHHPQDGSQRPGIRTEHVSFDGDVLYRFSDGDVHLYKDGTTQAASFPFRPERSFLPNLEGRGTKLGWFKDFVGGIRILQLNPFDIRLTSKQEEKLLNRYGRNFPAFFDYLNTERPQGRAELEKQLGEVIPGFCNFLFRRTGEEKLLLASFAPPGGKPYELLLGDLSEGQRTLAILYSVVFGLVGSVSVLCFDEPDNFVSLAEIQPWLQSLRDTVEARGGQAMVISHHPEVIDYLALDSAWRFERPAGPVVVRPIEVDASSGLTLSQTIARGE
jgi:putative AbiEii toxin of type IV toxin-antitoxin system